MTEHGRKPGRPPGSSKLNEDDAIRLTQIAEKIIADPALSTRAAIQRVVGSNPSTIRRMERKFRRNEMVQAAKERAAAAAADQQNRAVAMQAMLANLTGAGFARNRIPGLGGPWADPRVLSKALGWHVPAQETMALAALGGTQATQRVITKLQVALGQSEQATKRFGHLFAIPAIPAIAPSPASRITDVLKNSVPQIVRSQESGPPAPITKTPRRRDP